ncbi:heme-binding protein [Burkholderia cenocepacia]|uniref:GlcG/HbpS family heme-binding protein n=1 Tax=Burkholderia cepacia complex TaxID=87882 RepID=UPI001B97E800|nr:MULTISPECIES: heme-binding protein [Burkholderia cepacia complex]ELW9445307.1 heme-binding protein [Burkholderia cenocepacia]MBR8480852.1 heme-binding protein [Burkholderia cenocepacia]MDN7471060.1 heme-binding protein [Burkholderia orbicola]MDN7506508.1 heme-binding protein [Burkholderia orbicola]
MIIRTTLATLVAVTLTSAASAQVLQEKNLPLNLAADIAQQTIQACSASGYNVTVTVVDRSGVERAVLRGDNAGLHTVDASKRKAYTAMSTKTPTATLATNLQKNPAAAQITAIDGFLVLGGGVPIKAGDEVIGAVGVGGAPGGHLDEACALQGIARAQAKLM